MTTERYVLHLGGHDTREDGMCLMELVAFLGGEEHSAFPQMHRPDAGPRSA